MFFLACAAGLLVSMAEKPVIKPSDTTEGYLKQYGTCLDSAKSSSSYGKHRARIAMEEVSGEIIIELGRPGPPTLQIASDLHLEFVSKLGSANEELEFMANVISPKAQVLALLGDIGIPTHPFYKRFLLHQAEQFEAVLVLAGNHEFYDIQPPGQHTRKRDNQTWSEFYKEQAAKQSVRDMKLAISAICAEHPNLHFVDNTRVRFGREPGAATLLCSTLWSHIPVDAIDQVGATMNDYAMIYTSSDSDTATKDSQGVPVSKLTPKDTCQWHAEAVGWLESEIAQLEANGCHCIGVLTHHTPSMRGTSAPQHEVPGNVVNHAFSTDLDQLLRRPSVKLWAYGHTHFNNDQVVHGTRLVSNQHGYVFERDENYRSDFVIDMSDLGNTEDSMRSMA
jgi:hypothetical protein